MHKTQIALVIILVLLAYNIGQTDNSIRIYKSKDVCQELQLTCAAYNKDIGQCMNYILNKYPIKNPEYTFKLDQWSVDKCIQNHLKWMQLHQGYSDGTLETK